MKTLHEELELRENIINFLQEDVGTGDITSNLVIPRELKANAKIICKSKSPIIVAGLEESSIVLDICNCKTIFSYKDGDIIKPREVVLKIQGNAINILKAERLVLNIIMRMSGIATETKKHVDLLTKNNFHKIRISATRKTVPGFRKLDKKAVVLGGGSPHRMRLDDMILIKDNHISIVGSVKKAITLAKSQKPSSIKIECEVQNLDQAIDAINSGADIVMLDNFSPTEAMLTTKELEKLGIRDKALVELSGGINIDNILEYAKSNPDIISIGYLTHSVQSIDFSLDIKTNNNN